MATLLKNITSKNWQISTAGLGIVAEGIADIRQCLEVIFSTEKGSDAIRPEFGCDLFTHIDRPINIAVPNIIKSIIESAEIWEPRVIVQQVRYELISPSHVRFEVVYSLVDAEVIDMLIIYMNGGYVQYLQSGQPGVIIYGIIPDNPNGKRYALSLAANGSPALPVAPSSGFATAAAMLQWASVNYSGYGRWQLGSDRITLIGAATVVSGTIAVRLTGVSRFLAPFPDIAPGQAYAVVFNPDGGPPSQIIPASFATIAETLAWFQANMSNYGTWAVEGNDAVEGDFDSRDFSELDFFVALPGQYALVLYSEIVGSSEFYIEAA